MANASGARTDRIASATLAPDALHGGQACGTTPAPPARRNRKDAEPRRASASRYGTPPAQFRAFPAAPVSAPNRTADSRPPERRAMTQSSPTLSMIPRSLAIMGFHLGAYPNQRDSGESPPHPPTASATFPPGGEVILVHCDDAHDRSRPPKHRPRRPWPERAGSNTPTIIATCVLSAWPAPTTDFLTRLAAYSRPA